MSKRERDYMLFVEDIITAARKIEKYTYGLSFEEFSRSDITVDAVVRNFEIIGEAVKKIPEAIKKKYPTVDWKEAAGFRDILIHNYFGIDLEAVWETVKNNISPFKKQIATIFKSEKS